VAQVAEIAEREGIRIALCGGLAMQSYGSPRLTRDVDLVADARLSSLPSNGRSRLAVPRFWLPMALPSTSSSVRMTFGLFTNAP